jgi:hypothetical protein
MSFRDDIKKHADTFWSQPCRDGLVWTFYRGINIASEISTRKLSAGDWTGAFLDYNGGKHRSEGLFLIKKSERAAALKTWRVESCPSAIMLATFHDNRAEDSAFPAGKPPKDYGLNDCTHFTSECIEAGGLPASIKSIHAGEFYTKLFNSDKTKTLARTVKIADAKFIIEAPRSPFKTGDVIVYSADATHHHHGLVYMGERRIAMHTVSIHRDHPTLGGSAFWDRLSGDDDHDHVTLYHLDMDDFAATAGTWLPGWWRVTSGAQSWFYFFDAKGRVQYVNTAPTNKKLAPASPAGKGYWFEDGALLSLCWTNSGTFERFTFKPGTSITSMTGTMNGVPGLTATKM